MLSVETGELDGATILRAAGELDISARSTMRAALERAVDGSEVAVVVDLTDVTFIDSTGLALLLNARRRLVRAQRGFAIACSPGRVRRTFELAGLEESLCVHGSLDAALDHAQPALSG